MRIPAFFMRYFAAVCFCICTTRVRQNCPANGQKPKEHSAGGIICFCQTNPEGDHQQKEDAISDGANFDFP